MHGHIFFVLTIAYAQFYQLFTHLITALSALYIAVYLCYLHRLFFAPTLYTLSKCFGTFTHFTSC